MSMVEVVKETYLTEDTPVMSEFCELFKDKLTIEEIKTLLNWAGDDEFVTVLNNKSIVCYTTSLEELKNNIDTSNSYELISSLEDCLSDYDIYKHMLSGEKIAEDRSHYTEQISTIEEKIKWLTDQLELYFEK